MLIALESILRHVAQYVADPSPASRETGSIDSLRESDRRELSGLSLGFYLANWGMYRGGAPPQKHSFNALGTVIEEIVLAPREIWEINAFSFKKS